MEARLAGLELSSREIARECANLRRRVSRALTRTGQIAAAYKAARLARERAEKQEKTTSHAAGDEDGAPALAYTSVDPSTWPEYFSEEELSTAVKVHSVAFAPRRHASTCTRCHAITFPHQQMLRVWREGVITDQGCL